MLSVGAVPPAGEAITFHVMSDCSSGNVERRREVVANLKALSQYLLAQLHIHNTHILIHTHTYTHTDTHIHTRIYVHIHTHTHT